MKACLRLALALFVLAGLVTIPGSADGNPFAATNQLIDLECARFCMVALCASPQTCGVFIDANGQRACGCHDPIIRP